MQCETSRDKGNFLITGVEVHPLKTFPDERGIVLHMLRDSDPYYNKFSEIYFSLTNPGQIKAWKLHKVMVQNFAVPVGKLKLVIFDDRNESETRGELQEFILGQDQYNLIRIPPGLWYGIQAISEEPALLANCASIVHDDEECLHLPTNNDLISYKWQTLF